MRVVILGASGKTGRYAVATAVNHGHDVVAVSRNSQVQTSQTVTNAVGSVLDETFIEETLRGADAVIDTLGLSKPVFFSEVDFFSTSTAIAIRAMKKQGVDRLITMTGMGAGDSRWHNGFFIDYIVYPILAQRVYADKNRQENLIADSDLEWTIVRPGLLTSEPSGAVTATVNLKGVRGGKIARQDVARFMVSELVDRKWIHQRPSIFYR